MRDSKKRYINTCQHEVLPFDFACNPGTQSHFLLLHLVVVVLKLFLVEYLEVDIASLFLRGSIGKIMLVGTLPLQKTYELQPTILLLPLLLPLLL